MRDTSECAGLVVNKDKFGTQHFVHHGWDSICI